VRRGAGAITVPKGQREKSLKQKSMIKEIFTQNERGHEIPKERDEAQERGNQSLGNTKEMSLIKEGRPWNVELEKQLVSGEAGLGLCLIFINGGTTNINRPTEELRQLGKEATPLFESRRMREKVVGTTGVRIESRNTAGHP